MHVTIETAHSPVIEVGRLLSVVGILAILAILLYTGPLSWIGVVDGSTEGRPSRSRGEPQRQQ